MTFTSASLEHFLLETFPRLDDSYGDAQCLSVEKPTSLLLRRGGHLLKRQPTMDEYVVAAMVLACERDGIAFALPQNRTLAARIAAARESLVDAGILCRRAERYAYAGAAFIVIYDPVDFPMPLDRSSN